MHFCGEIDDVGFCDGGAGGNVGRGEVIKFGTGDEGGFLFKAIDAGVGVETEFCDVVVGWRLASAPGGGIGGRCSRRDALEHDAEKFCSRGGEGDRVLRCAAGGQVGNGMEGCAIVACLERFFRRADAEESGCAPVGISGDVGEGADGGGRGKFKLDPRRFADGSNW